jgi:hypothetical protein
MDRLRSKTGPPTSRAAAKGLLVRDWSGNVRELENAVERAVISSRGPKLEIADNAAVPFTTPAVVRRATLEQLEHDHIVATLEQLHWRVEDPDGAADALGINASTLRTRMRKHGIRRHAQAPGCFRGLVCRVGRGEAGDTAAPIAEHLVTAAQAWVGVSTSRAWSTAPCHGFSRARAPPVRPLTSPCISGSCPSPSSPWPRSWCRGRCGDASRSLHSQYRTR